MRCHRLGLAVTRRFGNLPLVTSQVGVSTPGGDLQPPRRPLTPSSCGSGVRWGAGASGGYHGDVAAGADAVAHAQALVVGVLAPLDEVLVAGEVGAVVDHEEAALHPAGVAAAQVGGHVGAVAAGLVGPALEVPVLVEDDLREGEETEEEEEEVEREEEEEEREEEERARCRSSGEPPNHQQQHNVGTR